MEVVYHSWPETAYLSRVNYPFHIEGGHGRSEPQMIVESYRSDRIHLDSLDKQSEANLARQTLTAILLDNSSSCGNCSSFWLLCEEGNDTLYRLGWSDRGESHPPVSEVLVERKTIRLG
jgi:hypothetical protein